MLWSKTVHTIRELSTQGKPPRNAGDCPGNRDCPEYGTEIFAWHAYRGATPQTGFQARSL